MPATNTVLRSQPSNMKKARIPTRGETDIYKTTYSFTCGDIDCHLPGPQCVQVECPASLYQ
jgi:hypothetical protein